MSRFAFTALSILLLAAGFWLGLKWQPSSPPHAAAPSASPGALDSASRLPGPQDKALLALIEASKETNGSALYNFRIFNYYAGIWRIYGKATSAASALEIGPGANLGQGMLLLATGTIDKYTGLDLHKGSEVNSRHGYQAAYELLSRVSPASVRLKAEQIYSIDAESVVFNPERIQYLFPRQSYEIGLPDGSLDFVFSHSVFEHIADPARTVDAIGKALRSGGLSAHHVDMRDHTDFSKPLEFLKFDESSWAARFVGAQAHLYMNRQRLSDFLKLFESAGFRILKVEPTTRSAVSEEARRGLHPDFQAYALEDLSILTALIVAQKP